MPQGSPGGMPSSVTPGFAKGLTRWTQRSFAALRMTGEGGPSRSPWTGSERLWGRSLEVMFPTDTKHDLVDDFSAVLTSMASRIYGRRHSKVSCTGRKSLWRAGALAGWRQSVKLYSLKQERHRGCPRCPHPRQRIPQNWCTTGQRYYGKHCAGANDRTVNARAYSGMVDQSLISWVAAPSLNQTGA